VRALSARVHAVKPWLPVGISPFALPRAARRPPGIEGFDPHAKLYADAERWFEEGLIDYAAPQLYWPLAQRAQAFGVLLDHWASINARGRHLWPGLYTSRVGNPWPADEIVAQLAHLRARPALAGGHIHFSMVALMDDRGGLASRLLSAPATPALVPASPWRPAPAPPVPLLQAQGGRFSVRAASSDFARFVLWQRRGERWQMSVHDRREAIALPQASTEAPPLQAVVASTLGLNGVESARIAWRAPTAQQ
jgi:Glycosyl hydrolase-like 10